MTQSAFSRTSRDSQDAAKEVVDLASFRSMKSFNAIIKAIKVMQASEAAAGLSGQNIVNGPAKQVVTQSVDGPRRVLQLVKKITQGERQAQFAERMFAITGNSVYKNCVQV